MDLDLTKEFFGHIAGETMLVDVENTTLENSGGADGETEEGVMSGDRETEGNLPNEFYRMKLTLLSLVINVR